MKKQQTDGLVMPMRFNPSINRINESDHQKSYFNKRNIGLISFAAFIWSIYYSIQGQFLNDYLLDLTAYSPLVISLLVSVVSLTGAIASIFAGSLNDSLKVNFGRRKLFILIGGLTSAMLLFLLPLSQSLIFILGINILMSTFNTGAFVCNNSLIPAVSTAKTLGKTNAFASFGSSIGTIAGFALMLIAPKSNVFYVSGAICVFGFLIVGLFFQEPEPIKYSKHWAIEIKETFSFSEISQAKELYKFIGSHFFLHLGINTYVPFLLVFLTQKNDFASGELVGLGLSVDQAEVLIVFAVMTLVSLIVTFPIGLILDKLNKKLCLIISRFLFVITTAILGLTPFIQSLNPLVVAILFIIPYSLANTSDIISRGAVMHLLTPDEKRGQLLGVLFFVKILAQIPGVLIGGLVAHFMQRGYQFNFLIGAFFTMFSIILLIPFKKILQRRHSEITEPNKQPF